MSDEGMKPRNEKKEDSYTQAMREFKRLIPEELRSDDLHIALKICGVMANIVSVSESDILPEAKICIDVFFDVFQGRIREVDKSNQVQMEIYTKALEIFRNDSEFLHLITGQKTGNRDFLISNEGRINVFERNALGKRT